MRRVVFGRPRLRQAQLVSLPTQVALHHSSAEQKKSMFRNRVGEGIDQTCDAIDRRRHGNEK